MPKRDEREDVADYRIKGLVGSLSLVGEFELAREAAKAILNKKKAVEAMLSIAKESRDLEDLRNVERLIRDEVPEGFDRNGYIEKLICILAGERIYIWAEVLAKNSEYDTSNLGRIAKAAMKNGDLETAVEYALAGQDSDTLFEVLVDVIGKDLDKAREIAEKMQPIWWGNFYRAWAYVGIYYTSGESRDIEKAASVILDAIKNNEPRSELDRYSELAIIIAANSNDPEIIEELSKLLDPLEWRSEEVLEKSIETLLLGRKKKRK